MWEIAKIFKLFKQWVDRVLDYVEPLIPEWVTPNRLTKCRMWVLTPMVLMTLWFSGYGYAAMLIYSVAGFTDLLDGYLARKRDLVTVWGKAWDDRADKICVYVPLTWWILLSGLNYGVDVLVLALTLVLLIRDGIMVGVRECTSWTDGIETPLSAKWKAALQMVGVGILLGSFEHQIFYWSGVVFLSVAVPLSFYSASVYMGHKVTEWFTLAREPQ